MSPATSPATSIAFPHRQRPDGSIDSICSECFQTIATASTEAELSAAETVHDCKGFSLVRLFHREQDHRVGDDRQQAAEG
jgi:hypothetical protein